MCCAHLSDESKSMCVFGEKLDEQWWTSKTSTSILLKYSTSSSIHQTSPFAVSLLIHGMQGSATRALPKVLLLCHVSSSLVLKQTMFSFWFVASVIFDTHEETRVISIVLLGSQTILDFLFYIFPDFCNTYNQFGDSYRAAFIQKPASDFWEANLLLHYPWVWKHVVVTAVNIHWQGENHQLQALLSRFHVFTMDLQPLTVLEDE